MKANETKCLPFLKQPKQFQIPIYQRPYSWTRRQCDKLWKDVLGAGREADIDSHFSSARAAISRRSAAT